MLIKRVRIDYTVYPPDHNRGRSCRKFRTFETAKSAACALGIGARIYRQFSASGKVLGDWSSGNCFWLWNGKQFELIIDPKRQKPVRAVPRDSAVSGAS